MTIRNVYFIFFGALLFYPQTNFAQKEKELKSAGADLEFPCPPEDINITKFKDTKKWQVVVNRLFTYQAAPKSNTDDWGWSLGDLNAAGDSVIPFWMFQNPLDAYKGTGVIINLPPNNSDFGPAHGQIQATANLNGLPKKDLSDDPDETVKVFFVKDEVHPVSGTPNWFHYWSESQPIQDLLTIPGIRLWDMSTCMFQDIEEVHLTLIYGGMPYDPEGSTYGSSNFSPRDFDKEDPYPDCDNNSPAHLYAVGYKANATKILIGEGCGFRKSDPGNPSANPIGNIEGIHVLYSTVAHEVEHTEITCEVWSDGYDSAFDEPLPIRDDYRDNWETQTNIDNAGIPGYCPFTIGVDDGFNEDYVEANIGNCTLETAGTNYEEIRCRKKATELDLTPVNEYDWSFDPITDPLNLIQGKQW